MLSLLRSPVPLLSCSSLNRNRTMPASPMAFLFENLQVDQKAVDFAELMSSGMANGLANSGMKL